MGKIISELPPQNLWVKSADSHIGTQACEVEWGAGKLFLNLEQDLQLLPPKQFFQKGKFWSDPSWKL